MEMVPDPRTSPAELTVDTVRAWLLELTEVERRIGAQFPRWDARRRAGAYLRGLLSPVEQKNGWQLAEVNGDDTPYRAVHAGVPMAWVTGDSVYGDDRRLRMWREAQERADVLAVSGKEYVWLHWQQHQVKTLLAGLPTEGWTRYSAGAGATGPRWYDWRWLPLALPMQPTWRRWLLVRQRMSDPTERTACVVFAPQGTPLGDAVQTAGSRWAIESCFEGAKGEVGLDQYEVRSWTGWYRHMTLAMWAYALLTAVRARHLQALP